MAASSDELLQLTVDIEHPDCWTLRTTAASEAGLLGHGMVGGASATGREFGVYTAFADSADAIDHLLEEIETSSLTERVTAVSSDLSTRPSAPGVASRDLLVEFDPGPSIRRAFAERGFLHWGPSVHEDGTERRRFLAWAHRQQLNDALSAIESEYEADVEITSVSSAQSPTDARGDDALTTRQREAFVLARDRGYYDYPRGTTTRALAAELGISKTTYLEHLRKAEAKLLRSITSR
jgi:predicted DNA binding protein